jgi:hypothetical protein
LAARFAKAYRLDERLSGAAGAAEAVGVKKALAMGSSPNELA